MEISTSRGLEGWGHSPTLETIAKHRYNYLTSKPYPLCLVFHLQSLFFGPHTHRPPPPTRPPSVQFTHVELGLEHLFQSNLL
jgi:hypothetical protein